MSQKISPFIEGKYGWEYGESGWNSGMDENLLKFSFLFDGNVDSIVSSLPPLTNGLACFNTTDKRFYFAVNGSWVSSPCPKHFVFKIRSTGDFWQFNGTTHVEIDNPSQIGARLSSLEATATSLGTAAFLDADTIITQASLDVMESNLQGYTDALREDLGDDVDNSKGASLVGHNGSTVASLLDQIDLRISQIPAEVDAAGTADLRVSNHNSDAFAHPALSDFIVVQANRAEAAADVAQLSTSIFDTTSAGLAATTSGQYFSVPSAASAEYLILYRNNSGVASEVKRYPSAAGIAALDSTQINRSKNYPLKQLTRNGITSPANVHFTVPLLDVKVIGPADALAGKYFRISYLQNGATLGGVAANGVILEEFPVATYESSDSRTIIHNYTDAPASYDRSKGGIQTFVIQPALRPSLRFVVTMDVSLMRPAGSPLNSSSSSANDGWSWIIDPSAYYPVAVTGSSVGADSGPLYVTYTHATKTLDVVSFSDDGMMRMSVGPNGYNNLPNPKSVSRAAGSSPAVAAWEPVSTQSTEWFGVMHIQALTNGDGGERIATGGNHGSSGGAGGAQTARNLLCAVRIDGGAPLTADYSGYAENVQMSIVNELMAYNTITLGRYVLRQSFQLDFRGPAIFVRAKMRALEPIAVQRDRALQFVTDGFEETIIFGDGANTGRSAFNLLTSTSGTKTQAPNAWIVNMRGPAGELSSWMDRGFGAASGEWVDANSALIHLSGSSSTHKGYNAVIYGGTMERTLASSETYEWRGGYALRYGLSSGAGTNIDSTIPISLDGSARLAVIYTSAKTDGL